MKNTLKLIVLFIVFLSIAFNSIADGKSISSKSKVAGKGTKDYAFIVTIRGEGACGLGFMGVYEDKTYIFSNQNVLFDTHAESIKNIFCGDIKYSKVLRPVDERNLICFELKGDHKPVGLLEIETEILTSAQSNNKSIIFSAFDPVSQTASWRNGKLTGLGPEQLTFIENKALNFNKSNKSPCACGSKLPICDKDKLSNSIRVDGAPIISYISGKVIGVGRNLIESGVNLPLGVRIDTVSSFEEINMVKFLEESNFIKQIEAGNQKRSKELDSIQSQIRELRFILSDQNLSSAFWGDLESRKNLYSSRKDLTLAFNDVNTIINSLENMIKNTSCNISDWIAKGEKTFWELPVLKTLFERKIRRRMTMISKAESLLEHLNNLKKMIDANFLEKRKKGNRRIRK